MDFQIWKQVFFLLCGYRSFFMILLILDVYKSWHTHSFWIAPKFLSLNAFTLQIMSALVDVFQSDDVFDLISIQLVVDATRLMSCISIVYIIPDVAHYSVHQAWEYLSTLFLIVVGQLIYRIYSIFGNHYLMEGYKTNSMKCYKTGKPTSGEEYLDMYEINCFIIFTGIYFLAVFLLVLVLACTLAAGKTMKALVMNKITRRISKLNSTRSQSDPPIPIDEVFYELWLVVRSSRPSNVAARSVLSSASTFIATLLVGFTIIKWALLSQHAVLVVGSLIIAVLECIFIIGGWFALLWRWSATVYYFSCDNSPYYLRKYITQSEKEVNYNQYISKFFVFPLSNHSKEKILIRAPAFVHHSLKPVFCIMKSFILLCGIASKIFISLTKLLNKIIKSKKQQNNFTLLKEHEAAEYATYINSLSDFTMFGESPEILRSSNFRAFKKVKTKVEEGNIEGKKLWGDIQVLCDGADHPQLHFNEECCWKMEVIWHVTMLMCCYCHSNSNEEAEEAICKAIQYGGSTTTES